jgi:hypothetical protein
MHCRIESRRATRRRQIALLAGSTSPGPTGAAANPVEIAPELLQVGTEPLRRLSIEAGMSRAAEDRGTAGAKDARLLATDRLAVATQPVAVIEIDRRDQRDVGVYDVHASSRPPMPTSSTTASRPASANTSKRRAR